MASPSALHSSISCVMRSLLRISVVIVAAMNSAGWCAFSHAVWMDSSA